MRRHYKWLNPLLFVGFPFFTFAYFRLFLDLKWRDLWDTIIWVYLAELLLLFLIAIFSYLREGFSKGALVRFFMFLSLYLGILLLPLYFYLTPKTDPKERLSCKIDRIHGLLGDSLMGEDMVMDEFYHMDHRLYVEAMVEDHPKDSAYSREGYLLILTKDHSKEDMYQAKVRYLGIYKGDSLFKRGLFPFAALEERDSALYEQWKDLAWNLKMMETRDSFEQLQDCGDF